MLGHVEDDCGRCREEELAIFAAAAGASIGTLQDLAARYPGAADPGQVYLRAVEPHLPPSPPGSGAVGALAEIHADSKFRANMGRKPNWEGDDLKRLGRLQNPQQLSLKAHGEFLSLCDRPGRSVHPGDARLPP